MPRRLILALPCVLALFSSVPHALGQEAYILAQDVLPAAVAEKLQTQLAQALGVPLTRGDTKSGPPTRGVLVLGSGIAHAKSAPAVTPAGLVASAPMILVAATTIPAVESADIIALIKKQAGAKIAHDGVGSASQRCFAQLKEVLATTFSEVQKAPDVPPATSVKSGDVDLACLEAPLAIPLIQAGAVTPVLVAGDERLAAVWDVPTAAEVGLPLFSVTAWFGLYLAGPEAKPEAIGKANLALQGVLGDDAMLQALTNAGLTPFPLTHRTPDAHAAFQSAEAERGK